MPKIGEMFLEISANNSKLRANLAEASSLIRDWSLLVTGLTSGITNAFRTITDIGVKGLTISLGILIGLFGVAAKTGADFEDAMVRTFAILNEGSEEAKQSFGSLTSTALRLGRDTLFSATQAAEGMKILAKAGFSAREIIDSIKPSVDLAIVGNLELSETTGFVVSALRSFNLETREAKRVVDILALGSSQANTTITELGSALSFVAPVAAGVGISLEELIATLGILADRGIKGSKAGTTLRRAITQLAAPTGRAKKILDELGLSFVDSAGNVESLESVIRKLNKSGINAAKTMEIFGLRAGPGLVALMKAGSDSIGQLEQKLQDSSGAADRMSQLLRTSVKGRMRDLIASVDLLGKSFSQKFNKPLANTIFAIRNYVIRLNSAGNRTGVFRKIIDGVISSMKPLTNLVSELSKEFLNFISNLTAKDITKFFDTLRDKVRNFVNIITSAEFRDTVTETFSIITSLGNTFLGTLKNIIALWKLLPDSIRPSVTAVGLVTAGMLQLFGGILNVIIFAISLRAVLVTLGGKAAAIGAAIFSWKVALSVALVFLKAISVIAGVIAALLVSIKLIQILNDTKVLKNIWEAFKAILGTVKELIVGIVNLIKGELDPFKNFAESVDRVLERLEELKKSAKEAGDKIKDIIPDFIKKGAADLLSVQDAITGVTRKPKESAKAIQEDTGFIEIGGQRIPIGKAQGSGASMQELLAQSGDLTSKQSLLSDIEDLGQQIKKNLDNLREDQVAERAAIIALSAGLLGQATQVNKADVKTLNQDRPGAGL